MNLRSLLPPTRTWRDRIVAALMLGIVGGGLTFTGWVVKQSLAVRRLNRGVGGTTFLSADGRPWFPLDENRRDVPLFEISVHLRRAVVAVEDHRFYLHPGIDPLGLARAILVDLKSGEMRQGGSTITQQLARTLFLSNARTAGRKAKEAVIAVLLEEHLTKDQLLELYLNRVYLGAGAYGVEAMSRKLYGRPARDLDIGESALLAGLIQAPSALSPWTNLEGALARRKVVLQRMREEGFITEAEEQRALATRPRLTARPDSADAGPGYAKDYLRNLFREEFGGDNPPDWKVQTTFVPTLQAAAERAVAVGLSRFRDQDLQAALVALDPKTGNILALVGGRDFGRFPFNRAVHARRQPGSAFKPIVYAAALERGMSPVSVLRGLPEVVAVGEQEWRPREGHGEDVESLTLREALAESNNRAAVLLQQEVGTGRVRGLAEDLGIPDLPDVASLALGTGEVSPLALTAAFAAFPNGGLAVRPRALRFVLDDDGAVAWEERPRVRRVLSEAAAYQTLSMLEDVVDRGTGASVRSAGLRAPLAGKTGTTNDFKDAWFVGFSSSVVVGVWVGHDQPTPIARDAYGAKVALPIWIDFMRRTARTLPARDFEIPPGLHAVELCRVTFLKPVDGCPTYAEYLRRDDRGPGALCPEHEGTLKQEAKRAVQDVLRAIGRKIGGIFH